MWKSCHILREKKVKNHLFKTRSSSRSLERGRIPKKFFCPVWPLAKPSQSTYLTKLKKKPLVARCDLGMSLSSCCNIMTMGFEGILAWLQLKASQWCSRATWVLDLDEVPFSGPYWRILKSLTLNNDDKDRGLPKSLLGGGGLWCPNHPKSDICASWAYPKFRVCVSSCYHSLSIGTLAHGSLDVSSLD